MQTRKGICIVHLTDHTRVLLEIPPITIGSPLAVYSPIEHDGLKTVLDSGKAFRATLRYRRFEVTLSLLPNIFVKNWFRLKCLELFPTMWKAFLPHKRLS